MKSLHFSRLLAVCLCLVMLISTGGAYATWVYAESPAIGVGGKIGLEMKIFQWPGSEVLPDDEETGHAHATLIDNIINGEDIGLNYPNSYLNEQIAVRLDRYGGHDTLGSMAITQGDELTRLFNLKTENVTFLIQMVNDNLYYIFTTSLDLGEKRKPTYKIGSTISPIYRTTVVKENGKWVATDTKEGSATSAYYEETQPSLFENISRIPSFNPSTWKETT